MYEINGDYLDDERANLNVQLSQPILVVGDLGLWNGRRMGYKENPPAATSGTACIPTQIIPPGMWTGWAICGATPIHHDGTNFYLYRVYKDSASPSQIELLKEKLYRGIATPRRYYESDPQAGRRHRQSLRVFHSPAAAGRRHGKMR